MSIRRRDSIVFVSALLGSVLMPVVACADDDGWLPIVVQTGPARFQPYQPMQPAFQGKPRGEQPEQRPKPPTPQVWQQSGPAYETPVPKGAQVSQPTLTDHGLQMPAPRVRGGNRQRAVGGVASPIPPEALAPRVIVPPLPQQMGGADGELSPSQRAEIHEIEKAAAKRAAAAKAAKPVEFNEPVGAIPVTRSLSKTDSARLKVAATGSQASDQVEMPESDLARSYCVNVSDAAADARMAWQQAKIAEAEKKLQQRIAALEAKTAEYKAWLKRRDEFSNKANDTLVQIYAQMESDAAAPQLASMDEETAASVLAKLDPQYSAAILNVMQPEKAARLTATIAGAARVAKQREQQRAQQNAQAAQAAQASQAAQSQANTDQRPGGEPAQGYGGGGQ